MTTPGSATWRNHVWVALTLLVALGSDVAARTAPRPAPRGPRPDFLTRVAAKIAPHKFADASNPAGPNRVTEERPFAEAKGSLFGLEVGITFSELHQVRAKEGIELVHVVNPNGGSNLELVLARKELGRSKQRIELQGPAINTSLAPGELPVGFRVLGLGLTSDLVDRKSKEAVSYTAEVKITERTAMEAASLFGPGAAASLAGRLGGGHAIAEVFSTAVPLISTVLFASSARWAWKVVHDPKKSRLDKTLAVAHAASDGVRIFFPLAGTIANAAIVGISAGVGLWRIHQLRRRAEPAAAR